MSDNTFVQERAYIYVHVPEEEPESKSIMQFDEEDDTTDSETGRGFIVIDILGE